MLTEEFEEMSRKAAFLALLKFWITQSWIITPVVFMTWISEFPVNIFWPLYAEKRSA